MAKATEPQHLCEALFHAESEDDVIRILSDAGYWDAPKFWRHYGDVPNNWGQGGNQQSLAEAALAEKIVNSVDARLVNECWIRGINPESDAAPKSIRAAVAKFFDGTPGTKMATGGYVEDWGNDKIREVAQGITLSATGTRPILNVVVADSGEGQTPERLPRTILSLNESNKSNTAFVQGQFNQGGTGALRFCGKHNLQLVISRRNQALVNTSSDARDQEWGFTIVRRERPAGTRRNSVLTYLAPLGVDAGKPDFKGDVLSFRADTFGMFPDKDGPYSRKASYGTAIKLYEYKYLGEKSNILRGRSLLSRLDLLLPEVALPVRMFEYRSNQRGEFLKPGSRETTLLGLRRRLIDSENVETGFPVSIPFSPQGEKLVAHIFAFKPEGSVRDDDDQDDDSDKPKKKLGGILRYRKQEGVLFVRNGQTHGSLGKEFFRRNSIKMKPLADDLLVFVDCDELSNEQREDLFMASRDRLVGDEFRAVLIAALEKALHDCEPLKILRNQRQQQRINDRFQEDRPLNEVLQSLIKSSPNLTALLQLGQRISAPFSTVQVGSDQSTPFKGEVYPTFFKAKSVEYGKLYTRDCPINQRMRLTFETNARNDYFTRRIERGQFFLTWTDTGGTEKDASYVGPTLKDGIASVMLDLPDEVAVGDEISFTALAKDTRSTFENKILVRVKPEAQTSSGGGGGRRPPAENENKDRERPSQVAPPQIKRVYRDEWESQGFDEFTAMKVEAVGYDGDDDSTEIYEFQINMDNTPLLNEIKLKRLDDVSARNQFLYANVLVGLSLLLQDKQMGEKRPKGTEESNAAEATVEVRVENTCRALAPFLLALTSLGESDLSEAEDVDGLEETG